MSGDFERFLDYQVEALLRQARLEVWAEDNCQQLTVPVRITPQEVMQRIESGQRLIFVDARPVPIWNQSDATIPNAIHIPPGTVKEHLGAVALSLLTVTFCTLPNEAASMAVARELEACHRKGARPLEGGLEAWRIAGCPIVPK